MSKDYVLRIWFDNGSMEPIKFDREEPALKAYNDLSSAVDTGKKLGEISLPDGTKFQFTVNKVSHWKFFKYTQSEGKNS